MQLINAAESLSHRLWNFSANWGEAWHHSDEGSPSYYELSFAYRFLRFYWWVIKVDDELVYLDTTLADKLDMDFIKYLRAFPAIMCQTSLFENIAYNHEHDVDHFFSHRLEAIVSSVAIDGEFPTYQKFEETYKGRNDDIDGFYVFLNGMSPEEDRLRWPRMFSLHLLLLSFLNGYAYSFQYTNLEKLSDIKKVLQRHNNGEQVLNNFELILSGFELTDNKEIKIMLDAKSI